MTACSFRIKAAEALGDSAVASHGRRGQLTFQGAAPAKNGHGLIHLRMRVAALLAGHLKPVGNLADTGVGSAVAGECCDLGRIAKIDQGGAHRIGPGKRRRGEKQGCGKNESECFHWTVTVGFFGGLGLLA